MAKSKVSKYLVYLKYHGEVNFNLDEYVGSVEVVTLTPTQNWTKSLNNWID